RAVPTRLSSDLRHAVDRLQLAETVPELLERDRLGVHQFVGGTAAGELHRQPHPVVLKSIVSAVSPGPNAIARPVRSAEDVRMRACKTNMTVGDDMLPWRRRTSREASRAAVGRSSACSTASRTDRPPGCTAQSETASGRQRV